MNAGQKKIASMCYSHVQRKNQSQDNFNQSKFREHENHLQTMAASQNQKD